MNEMNGHGIPALEGSYILDEVPINWDQGGTLRLIRRIWGNVHL
jgi:hypothetical protein